MIAKMWYVDPALRTALSAMGGEAFKEIYGHFFSPRGIFTGKVGAMTFSMHIALMRERRKAFILTDAVVERHAQNVAKDLQEAGFQTMVWNEAAPEPPISLVKKCADAMTKFEPDLIVAVGGGSTIDLAKAAWILYELPGYDLRTVTPLIPMGLRKKAILAAYPTTSGTGSEVTWVSVLTDDSVTPPMKIEVSSAEIVPDFAVLVPEFTVGMPPKLIAGTGLDALAHAVDAYLSSYDNDISDALAIKSTNLIFRFLPRAYRSPNDKEARYRMQLAATIAGLSFGNSQAALTHSLGHAVGKVFGLHHGVAVSIFIPYSIQYYSKASDKYIQLAREIGIKARGKVECLEKLVDRFKQFLLSFEIPYALKEHGITKERWEKDLAAVANYALEDACTLASSRPTSVIDIKRMLEYAYEGKDIDF
ncbi:MAG: iron-containing alcohol dehydrogenase [Chloroflexota bacterium]|nr:iron-containing alcohol dehydrogenase [Chloroflexota bacterium]